MIFMLLNITSNYILYKYEFICNYHYIRVHEDIVKALLNLCKNKTKTDTFRKF